MAFQVYTQRPDGTSLWLPIKLAAAIGMVTVKGANVTYLNGKQLTAEQYNGPRIQKLLQERVDKKGSKEDE
jgi:hypothetical protein